MADNFIDKTGMAIQVPDGMPNVPSIPAPVESPTKPDATLGKNITNMPTADIQKALGITADNVFGPQTTAAVKEFQKSHGLTPDGIVGPKTMAALQSGGVAPGGQQTQQTTPPVVPQQPQPETPAVDPNAPIKTGDPYLDRVNEERYKTLKESNLAYSNLQSTLNTLSTGTLKLAPEEQQYLDAMKASAQRASDIVAQAAAGQTGMTRYALAKSDQTQAAPEVAASQIALTIEAGANAIMDVNNKANLAIAQFQKDIRDGRIKSAREAYNDFKTAQKDRADIIDKMYKDVHDHEKEARDYSLAVKKYELDSRLAAASIDKTYAEISKIKADIASTGSASLGDSKIGKDISTAMAGIRFPSVADRKTATAAIAQLIANGDIKGAQDQIRTYAFNSMSADEQKTLSGKQDAVAALERIRTRLNEFKDAGGNTNIFLGLKQKALEKGGFYSGPASDIANDIALAIVDYRRAISGAAFTESEAKTYDNIFPSTGKTSELNDAKINTLITKLTTDTDNAYGRRIPKYTEIQKDLTTVKNIDDGKNTLIDFGRSNPAERENINKLLNETDPDLGRPMTPDEVVQYYQSTGQLK